MINKIVMGTLSLTKASAGSYLCYYNPTKGHMAFILSVCILSAVILMSWLKLDVNNRQI